MVCQSNVWSFQLEIRRALHTFISYCLSAGQAVYVEMEFLRDKSKMTSQHTVWKCGFHAS